MNELILKIEVHRRAAENAGGCFLMIQPRETRG
jgi:hypothetical protein